MLVVIDLNISNLNSVLNALDFLKIDYVVSNKSDDIKKATKFILPGVGTFEAGMNALNKYDITDSLVEEVVKKGKPILGICLGMQLFFETSEESPGISGLGLLRGDVIKLPENSAYTIPRIGWAESVFEKDFLGFEKDQKADFYYIHSFYAKPKDSTVIAISSEAGLVTGAVSSNNIFGCQFHPEKSHKNGLKMITNFSELT